MHRRTICLALGLALVSAAPHAEVALYGKIYAEFAVEERDPATEEFASLDDAQNTGRLGVRFSQPLEDGLAAFGQYEWAMNATDTGGNFVLRDAFVGLRSPTLGSLALGRFAGAYKTTGGINWDGFQFTGLSPIGNGGLSAGNFGHGGFVSRLVEYRTPRFGSPEGLRFDAVVQYGGDDSPENTSTAQGSALGGATLGYGGVEFVVAASGDKATHTRNHKAGLRWEGGDLALALIGESVENGGYDPGGEGRFLSGFAHWQSGKAVWMLQAGRYDSDYRDLLNGITDADARQLSIGVRYRFAANVSGLFGWRDTASDVDAFDSSALALGLRYDF